MKDLIYTCEIKKVEAKKTPSLDREFQVTLITEDPALLELGLIGASTLVKVTFQPVQEAQSPSGMDEMPPLPEPNAPRAVAGKSYPGRGEKQS